jgi:hypothetical protein
MSCTTLHTAPALLLNTRGCVVLINTPQSRCSEPARGDKGADKRSEVASASNTAAPKRDDSDQRECAQFVATVTDADSGDNDDADDANLVVREPKPAPYFPVDAITPHWEQERRGDESSQEVDDVILSPIEAAAVRVFVLRLAGALTAFGAPTTRVEFLAVSAARAMHLRNADIAAFPNWFLAKMSTDVRGPSHVFVSLCCSQCAFFFGCCFLVA